jgi:hypothetical protein
MLFYIEAKIVIRVQGISGPFEEVIVWLVNAPTLPVAKAKFEAQVRRDKARMEAQSFTFEYLKTAGTI